MLNAKGRRLLKRAVLLFIQFVIFLLKITGAVNWSWPVVLIPLWILIGLELIGIIVVLLYFKWLGKNKTLEKRKK